MNSGITHRKVLDSMPAMMLATPTDSSHAAAGGSQSEQLPFRSATAVRPKRKQVARACDWCRGHRIRCDNERPCANCRSRGGKCTSNGESELRTLPHALRLVFYSLPFFFSLTETAVVDYPVDNLLGKSRN